MMNEITRKVERGIRLSEDDALWLFEKADLGILGRLANRANLRKNGKAVFYNINRHINPTNICSLSCKFCAYSKKIGEQGGYAYEIDEMITKAGEAIAQGATELHMVGGLHPRWNFQRYVDMIAAMRKAYPDVHLKAFTAVELDWMARKARKSIAEVMMDLRDAGLNSFPGGGAEIFHPEVREKICDTKVSGEQWIDTHRTAHNMGIRSNCTMLYGHIESYAHRVDHMRRLRELQDETGGFNVFIPLAFQPFQNEMGVERYTFGADDLRTIAVARLYLDNFKHIKSYWVMLGQDVAQLALSFGANDLDGTVLEEKISRAAGGRSGMIMTRSNLESLIRRSGRTPVERTTLYEPVREEDRAHLMPVPGEDLGDEVAMLLGRLAESRSITPSDLWKIAMTAPLTTVMDVMPAAAETQSTHLSMTECVEIDREASVNASECATQIRNLLASSASIAAGDNATGNVSVLLNWTETNSGFDADGILATVKSQFPRMPIVVRGLKWALTASEKNGLRLTEYLAGARISGLEMLMESIHDEALNMDQKWMIMNCATASEIAVTPLLTLKSLTAAPDWSDWADRASEIRSRVAANPLIYSVALEIQPDSLVMPSEYMKAAALTRMYLPRTVQVWTPAGGMPVLAPQKGIGASETQHPVMKVISTVATFGTQGIGMVPINKLNARHVWEDLRAHGASPRLTCPRQNQVSLSEWASGRLENLRHAPCTSM
jgi:aminodeoxyfutalosine synthase